jgi:ABC-type transporter Mla maintaining outer membrane lipid asymmetry permease subunit MlaE
MSWIVGLGAFAYDAINVLGDVSLFTANTLAWMARRRPASSSFWTSCYNVGVRSLPVVAITGTFIGMVLAVQSYHEFHNLGLATRLGSIINISVVRELGPVLAATMIAGRVGSAMAAELGTMRVTDQIDALTCLGVNPLHYLVVPRLCFAGPAPDGISGRDGHPRRRPHLRGRLSCRGASLLDSFAGIRPGLGCGFGIDQVRFFWRRHRFD